MTQIASVLTQVTLFLDWTTVNNECATLNSEYEFQLSESMIVKCKEVRRALLKLKNETLNFGAKD